MCYKCLLHPYVCRFWCATLVFMTIRFWSMAKGAFDFVMLQSLTVRVCILCTVSIIQYYLLFSSFFQFISLRTHWTFQKLKDFQKFFLCYNLLMNIKSLILQKPGFVFFNRIVSSFQKLKRTLADLFTVVIKIYWNIKWRKNNLCPERIRNRANDFIQHTEV